jgi:hypothetical protein
MNRPIGEDIVVYYRLAFYINEQGRGYS